LILKYYFKLVDHFSLNCYVFIWYQHFGIKLFITYNKILFYS